MALFADGLKNMATAELTKIEKKLASLDLDHNNVPDIKEAEALIGSGVVALHALESKVSPDEMAHALNILFPGKFTAEEIVAGESAIDKLIAGFLKLKTIGASLPALLK